MQSGSYFWRYERYDKFIFANKMFFYVYIYMKKSKFSYYTHFLHQYVSHLERILDRKKTHLGHIEINRSTM